MNNSGFYKKDNTQILYAPNIVEGPNYMLAIEDKDNYSYPVDGWIYAGSIDEAIYIFSSSKLDIDSKLFKIDPEGFSLFMDDKSRNSFAQMLSLVKEALDLGLITNDSSQTIKDSDGNTQTVSTLRFRQIMVQYGMYYKSLWESSN